MTSAANGFPTKIAPGGMSPSAGFKRPGSNQDTDIWPTFRDDPGKLETIYARHLYVCEKQHDVVPVLLQPLEGLLAVVGG